MTPGSSLRPGNTGLFSLAVSSNLDPCFAWSLVQGSGLSGVTAPPVTRGCCGPAHSTQKEVDNSCKDGMGSEVSTNNAKGQHNQTTSGLRVSRWPAATIQRGRKHSGAPTQISS